MIRTEWSRINSQWGSPATTQSTIFTIINKQILLHNIGARHHYSRLPSSYITYKQHNLCFFYLNNYKMHFFVFVTFFSIIIIIDDCCSLGKRVTLLALQQEHSSIHTDRSPLDRLGHLTLPLRLQLCSVSAVIHKVQAIVKRCFVLNRVVNLN
jgi:hypothetical protein